MIDLLNDKQECCGCSACANICPKSAIEMIEDSEGFKYPSVNEELCIECGLCKNVCAFQNGYDTSLNLDAPLVFAAKHKDENVRMNSTSGGAFTAVSDYILSKSGVVYGVAFDGKMNVTHQRAETPAQRDRFRGSKYVQSDMGSVYKQITKDLSDDRAVLFTGTPCQCAGLRTYLKSVKINSDKLVVCDIICHGTPSPLIWREYINNINEENKVKNYIFRDKDIGWHGSNPTVVYADETHESKTPKADLFSNLYFGHLIIRPSCHNCKYTNVKRSSDITIADFWGIEKTMPDFDDNKGVSLIIVNTPKGKGVFDDIEHSLEYHQSNVDNCVQPQLHYPTTPSDSREQFWTRYNKKGYAYIYKKYTGALFSSKVKTAFVRILTRTNTMDLVKKILKRG